MDCLVFAVSGKYGQFRRPYTTTSALTFSCIHPIAARGLIGAIMGIDRTVLYQQTKDMQIGIRVCMPVRKAMQSIKLQSPTTCMPIPTTIEFLRDMQYEIFVVAKPEQLDELEMRLTLKKPVYTPCLGLSEHVAKVQYIGRYDTQPASINMVASIMPKSNLVEFDAQNAALTIDMIPTMNNDKREYIKYDKVVFAFSDSKPLELPCKTIDGVYDVNGTNITFF